VPSIFVKGLIIGFALAAPVGPIAALCVQRTMNRGRLAGFLSGFGSAAADAVYGTAAAFGASFISESLVEHGSWMQKLGGAILVVLGIRLFLTRPKEKVTAPATRGLGLAGSFLSTFLLTLTNPMTFLAFGAIFATMGLGATKGHSILTVDLVAGVTAGAALWWSMLVLAVYALRRHFTYEKLVWVNRAAGLFVVAVGLLYIFVLQSASVEPKLENRLRRMTALPPAWETRAKGPVCC
jgi:threonine/homoserine/homoserine lactone efflux protein